MCPGYARQVPQLRPVVLSGGAGTRLWPLSTSRVPKQFAPLFGERSLFELTLLRLGGLTDSVDPFVVAGAEHRSLVTESANRSGIALGAVVVEPVGRNTAPAAIAAALVADGDDVLVILPSDHLIRDVDGFRAAVGVAARHAVDGGIVTFGVRPTRPETGYGYIEIGEPRDSVFAVTGFKEKPTAPEAVDLVSGGRHLWNSGMFVVTAARLIDEAKEHCPRLLAAVRSALPAGDGPVIELSDGFAEIEPISIDYAIMERTRRAMVLPIDLGWDDVGSYQSLLQASPHDQQGNHATGDVFLRDVTGSLVKATSRKVVVAGLDDVVVVETPEAVLVIPLERSQEVRDIQHEADAD